MPFKRSRLQRAPFGIVLSSILFGALTRRGSTDAKARAGVSGRPAVYVLAGVILFSIAAETSCAPSSSPPAMGRRTGKPGGRRGGVAIAGETDTTLAADDKDTA